MSVDYSRCRREDYSRKEVRELRKDAILYREIPVEWDSFYRNCEEEYLEHLQWAYNWYMVPKKLKELDKYLDDIDEARALYLKTKKAGEDSPELFNKYQDVLKVYSEFVKKGINEVIYHKVMTNSEEKELIADYKYYDRLR